MAFLYFIPNSIKLSYHANWVLSTETIQESLLKLCTRCGSRISSLALETRFVLALCLQNTAPVLQDTSFKERSKAPYSFPPDHNSLKNGWDRSNQVLRLDTFNHLASNAFFDHFSETEICFVLTLGKDTSEEEFNLIKRTINYIVGEYGCRPAKYCVVLHEDNKIIGNINFKERYTTKDALRTRINQLQRPNSTSSLGEDLMATRSAFTNQTLGKEAKKVRNTCAQPFSRRSAVKFCPLTCSYGLILQSRAGYQALVSYTYRFIFSIDWIWRPHATVDLCLKHKHKSRFS